jgi:hypothetical protein
MVWPSIGADPYCVRAMIVRAIDQEAANARRSHFAKGDFGVAAGEFGHGAIEPHSAAVRKIALQVGLGYNRSHCRSRVFAN